MTVKCGVQAAQEKLRFNADRAGLRWEAVFGIVSVTGAFVTGTQNSQGFKNFED